MNKKRSLAYFSAGMGVLGSALTSCRSAASWAAELLEAAGTAGLSVLGTCLRNWSILRRNEDIAEAEDLAAIQATTSQPMVTRKKREPCSTQPTLPQVAGRKDSLPLSPALSLRLSLSCRESEQ